MGLKEVISLEVKNCLALLFSITALETGKQCKTCSVNIGIKSYYHD